MTVARVWDVRWEGLGRKPCRAGVDRSPKQVPRPTWKSLQCWPRNVTFSSLFPLPALMCLYCPSQGPMHVQLFIHSANSTGVNRKAKKQQHVCVKCVFLALKSFSFKNYIHNTVAPSMIVDAIHGGFSYFQMIYEWSSLTKVDDFAKARIADELTSGRPRGPRMVCAVSSQLPLRAETLTQCDPRWPSIHTPHSFAVFVHL